MLCVAGFVTQRVVYLFQGQTYIIYLLQPCREISVPPSQVSVLVVVRGMLTNLEMLLIRFWQNLLIQNWFRNLQRQAQGNGFNSVWCTHQVVVLSPTTELVPLWAKQTQNKICMISFQSKSLSWKKKKSNLSYFHLYRFFLQPCGPHKYTNAHTHTHKQSVCAAGFSDNHFISHPL